MVGQRTSAKLPDRSTRVFASVVETHGSYALVRPNTGPTFWTRLEDLDPPVAPMPEPAGTCGFGHGAKVKVARQMGDVNRLPAVVRTNHGKLVIVELENRDQRVASCDEVSPG